MFFAPDHAVWVFEALIDAKRTGHFFERVASACHEWQYGLVQRDHVEGQGIRRGRRRIGTVDMEVLFREKVR